MKSRAYCRVAGWVGIAAVLLAVSGCRHRRPVADELPPPPVIAPPPSQSAPAYPRSPQGQPLGRIPITPLPPGGVSPEDLDFVATHQPILSETGVAAWYKSPYRGRKAANGQIFDDNAMTAAERTLPMGSLLMVTNLKSGQSAVMRISDRGPFVHGRLIDLTIASAKATGVYWPGSAPVRVDVYQTPKPIDIGGRWCVQIGAFTSEERAIELKQDLLRTYPEARVIEFPGENHFWVRIRPVGDNREQAEYIVRHLQPVEGEAFLTRLD